ncbi:MAG: hypothetical protein EBZ59_08855 [Planctomycetia bacterium]|nr:hypothetical protein [Planctomycetia bacterium]
MPLEDDKRAASAGAGFHATPADGGLSIDRLARAFAAMMGAPDPYAADPSAGEAPADARSKKSSALPSVVEVDASPDLDAGSAESDAACRVSPSSILEAMLFVGMPGGEPLASRRVAALMRGVLPQEIDQLAVDLGRRYVANNCPYEVVSRDSGWLMRLRPEFAPFGRVLESRARTVRLDAESLDVLAAVAWNQPVARDRLVELGCDASPAVLRRLVRRGLLELRRPEPAPGDEAGEPCYHTTRRFLDVFRLESLTDLPEPHEPPR